MRERDEVETQIAKPGNSEAERRMLLERLRDFRGRLPSDFKFDRSKASAR
jgi:antitoxin MazE